MLHRMLLPLLGSLLLLSTSTVNSQTSPSEIVRFNFRFAFFDDDQTPLSDVMKDDVEGVLCQTQYFLSQLVQNATQTKSVHAKATEINWGFYEGADMPMHINFTVEFTDAMVEGDVNDIDDSILIEQMEKLEKPGLEKFITDWVWKSDPQKSAPDRNDGNFFHNANRMEFDGIKQAPVRGQLEEAECPETGAPTMAPTISAAPTGVEIPANETEDIPVVDDDDDGIPDPSPEAGAEGPAGGPVDNPNEPPAAGAGAADGSEPSENPIGPGGPMSRADWPFGDNYDDVAELAAMADFSLSFSMFQNHEDPPTINEVNALMCQVNEYFTENLRRKLMDGTIHSKAVFIDFFFDEGGKGSSQEDIAVNFTAFAYYGSDEHDQVAVQDVFEAMSLQPQELKDMVENYVWKSEPEQENIFFHTESLGLSAGVGKEMNPNAMLIEADGCVLPENEDGSAFGGVGGPGSSSGANPPASPVGGEGDPNLGLGGDAKQTEIVVNFRVSNLEGIKDPKAVKASGLDSSFPVFTNEMAAEMTARDAAFRRVLRNGRLLRVVPIPGSSTVDEVNEYPCPASGLPGLTCHSARAKYDVLMSSEEDTSSIQGDYTEASETAANDGTYNNVLQRVDPDTPLYIGIMNNKDQIPPGSLKRGYDGEDDEEDDGWFKWWYILILLLLLLLCCLCCLYCWMLNKKDEPTKETTIEEREILVEEFEDEEPGDDEEEFVEDNEDEEFVEDPAAAGAMVPYGEAPAPAPAVAETGVLVPFDPKAQKAQDDRAERDRILSESQRGEQAKKQKEDDQVWEEDV